MAKNTWENNNTLKRLKERTPVAQRDEIAAFQAEYDRKWNQPGPKDEDRQMAELFKRNVERGFKEIEKFTSNAISKLQDPFDYIYLMAGSSVAAPEDFDTEMWIVLNGDEDLGKDMVSALPVFKWDDNGHFTQVFFDPQADDDDSELLNTYLETMVYGGSFLTYKEVMDQILKNAHIEYQIDVPAVSFQNTDDILKLMQEAARYFNRNYGMSANFTAYDAKKMEYIAEGDIRELRQLYKLDLSEIDITILVKQEKDGLFISEGVSKFFDTYDRLTNRTM